MKPFIVCEHVDFGYENQDAVMDLSLEINPGDYLCIVGANGSGKSTLIKGLLGLLTPTAGRLTVAEELQPENPAEPLSAEADIRFRLSAVLLPL